MTYSLYIYSVSLCQYFSFETSAEVIHSIKSTLAKISFECGSNQFGRAVFTIDVLQGISALVDSYSQQCPKLNALTSYFKRLQEGEYFYIVDGSFPTMNRQIALVWLRANSMGLDTKVAWDSYLLQHGHLKTSFEYYSYGFDAIRHYIGEPDKSKRVCRFCHGVTKDSQVPNKEGPLVKFGNQTNAHAISDALGNKNLFCLEECCSCNEKLSKVERNLISLMDGRRALLQIKNKKNALPSVFCEEGALRVDEDGQQVLYLNEDTVKHSISENKLHIRLNNKKTITDQGVYKALCKYAISLMPHKYLSHFKQTIDWICGKLTESELPEVMEAYEMPFVSQPLLEIYFSSDRDSNTPLCTAMFFVCDICYLYILPLADVDGARFLKKGALSQHWKQFIKTYPGRWQSINLSNYRPSQPWIDITLSLDDPRIKIVPSTDERLKQPISALNSKSAVTAPRKEHIFPPFKTSCIVYKGTEVTEFKLLYNGPAAGVDLHCTTVEVLGIFCEISLVEHKAIVGSKFIVKNHTSDIEYFSFGFHAMFDLIDEDQYISVTDEYLALDYHLRDALYYKACAMSEWVLKKKLINTPFEICSLIKTLCDDERTIMNLRYRLIAHDRVYHFNDTDIHNNPFDV